ncbi:MAG: protealysin inhibitor emfourin [Paralcaligenes sp.]
MKIVIEISGGFAAIPKLSAPSTIDTDKIDARLAGELKSLLDQANFFDQPEVVNTPLPGSADLMTYIVTVQAEGRVHTVRITDPITDPSLQNLVERIRAIGSSERR